MRILATTAFLALSLSSGTAAAGPARFELDPAHTSVFFTVTHVGYAATLGIFGTVSGSFTYDADTRNLSDVLVDIDAASIDTFDTARNEHLRNQDFLDVSDHPQITFRASEGTATGDTSGTVTGDLTILGQTRPVTLNVTLNKAEAYPFGHQRFVLGLSLDTSIERSDFGMSYGVDNGLVGDTVTIRVETEAMRME